MPNTGPSEGSRRASMAFLPICRMPSASATDTVVFPSPAGVGLMAVTSTSRARAFRSSSAAGSTLAIYLP